MNRIGVVTLFHVRNLGAVLQAYAMGFCLKEAGYEVEFIMGYDKKIARAFFRGDIGGVCLSNLGFIYNKIKKFEKEIKYISEVKTNQIDTRQYRSIVFGSDSIWVPIVGKYRMPAIFFGQIANARKIAYAASSGGISQQELYGDEQKKALNSIDVFMVRDFATRQLVKDITGKDSNIVVDPTLLVDWEKILMQYPSDEIGCDEDYILLYGGFPIEYMDALIKLSKKKNLKLYSVGTFNSKADKSIAVGPLEFIKYIKKAKYVFTSMFHGVMLSIATKKHVKYISNDINRDVKLEAVFTELGAGAIAVKSTNDICLDYYDYGLITERKEEWASKCRKDLLNVV